MYVFPLASVTVKEPLAAPIAIGLKATLMAQLEPGATVEPQLLV